MDFDFGPGFTAMSDSRSGLGDIIIDPFILAWHSEHVHWVTGVDIYVPTGKYDAAKEPINPGNNVWTVEPIFAVTYLNGPFDVSFKFMYDISTTNDDYLNPNTGLISDLKPGQEFHFDYAFGYNLSPAWEVGLNGYYYRQVTEDEINGTDAADQKGQVLAAGPAVKFNYKNMSFILKSQWETAVKNRSEGVSNWFKFVYVF
ncbi:MAG: transporter [Desulfobacterales bacterium]|nr:transporter [Desulfobacterales bacterium]